MGMILSQGLSLYLTSLLTTLIISGSTRCPWITLKEKQVSNFTTIWTGQSEYNNEYVIQCCFPHCLRRGSNLLKENKKKLNFKSWSIPCYWSAMVGIYRGLMEEWWIKRQRQECNQMNQLGWNYVAIAQRNRGEEQIQCRERSHDGLEHR